MSKGDKKFIFVLLIFIIICAIILVFKIQTTPKYDKKLYEQVYAEYENISSSNIESAEQNENIKDNNIYMKTNSRGQQYRVAGGIIIPKIKLNYPIIYETTDEYLKIAPTKLYGPNVNEVGNLCVVGHNYKNDQLFSKLSDLEINDKLYLKSNNGKNIEYKVYDKYEINENDVSCLKQDTNGAIEATLITCTKKKENRLVVKCRALI